MTHPSAPVTTFHNNSSPTDITDDQTTTTAESTDDSTYSEESQSDSSPILNMNEVIASSSSEDEDDQESQLSQEEDPMPPLNDRDEDYSSSDSWDCAVLYSSDFESLEDSDVESHEEPDQDDIEQTGAQFRHMTMSLDQDTIPRLDPFSTDTNQSARAVSIHSALASRTKCHRCQEDPSESILGSPRHILNWLCDTGATAHMTPRLDDLENIENVDSVNVEVADGFTVPVNAIGICRLILRRPKWITLHSHNVQSPIRPRTHPKIIFYPYIL